MAYFTWTVVHKSDKLVGKDATLPKKIAWECLGVLSVTKMSEFG